MVQQLWARDDLHERSFHLGGSKPLRVEEWEEKQEKALFQEKQSNSQRVEERCCLPLFSFRKARHEWVW